MKKSILLLLTGALLGVCGTLVVSRVREAPVRKGQAAGSATPVEVPVTATAAASASTSAVTAASVTKAEQTPFTPVDKLDPVAKSRWMAQSFYLGWPSAPTTHKLGQYATMRAHHDPGRGMHANGRYLVTEINGKPVQGDLAVRLNFPTPFAIPREEPVHLSGYFSREVMGMPLFPLDTPEAQYIDPPQIPMSVYDVFCVTRIIEPAALNADLMQKMGVVLRETDPAATGP